jgi:hypothetical protein
MGQDTVDRIQHTGRGAESPSQRSRGEPQNGGRQAEYSKQDTAERYSHQFPKRNGTATSFAGRNWMAVPRGNWMAVPSRAARSPGPLMPPVEGPGGGPGERTEGGSGERTEDGPGERTEDGPGDSTPHGPGDSTPDGPGDGIPDGPGDGTGSHPGYRTPGDRGGSGRFWPIFLEMRWLGPFFGLFKSSHSCILRPPCKAWILARETSRRTPEAGR